ncbi:MAG TPA: hypothetical protein VLE99_06715 [Candidatus Saccharimonadales bacterium]|nr:hypothetical protein [Candidatus Saccharimonadales bacterium]
MPSPQPPQPDDFFGPGRPDPLIDVYHRLPPGAPDPLLDEVRYTSTSAGADPLDRPASTYSGDDDFFSGGGAFRSAYGGDTAQPEAPKGHRRRNIIAASIAAVALVGGGLIATFAGLKGGSHEDALTASRNRPTAASDSNHPVPTLSAGATVTIPAKPESGTPANSAPSQADIDRFQHILANDTCDPVTAESAATIYHNAYEVNPYQSMTAEQLTQAIDGSVAQFNQVRSAVEFPTLPADFAQLAADAKLENPQLPISTYQAAITQMAAQFNTPVQFDWDPAASNDEADQRGVPRPDSPESGTTRPLTAAEWDSSAARAGLVQILSDLSVAPLRELSDAHIPVIYFGKSTKAAGEVAMRRGQAPLFMFLDPYSATAKGDGVVGHETVHADDWLVCGMLTDAAWQATNPVGFSYNQDLPQGAAPDGRFTDEASRAAGESTGVVVTVNRYGATDWREDKATLGQDLNQPNEAYQLYAAMSPVVAEKLALYIARVKDQYPEIAAYYEAVLRMGQLKAAVESQLKPFTDQSSAMLLRAAKDINDGHGTPDDQQLVFGDPMQVSAYADLQRRIAAWTGPLSKLDQAAVPALAVTGQ